MKNKQETTYENIFIDLKYNINSFSIHGLYNPKELHCDLNWQYLIHLKKYLATKDKFCLWHFGMALEVNEKNILN